MKKLTSLILMFTLLSGNINYIFAQDAAQSKTLLEKAERYQTQDKPAIQELAPNEMAKLFGAVFGSAIIGTALIAYASMLAGKNMHNKELATSEVEYIKEMATGPIGPKFNQAAHENLMRNIDPAYAISADQNATRLVIKRDVQLQMKEIDAAAINLKGKFNPEAFAAAKLDICEITRDLHRYHDVSLWQRAEVENFIKEYFSDYNVFLSKSKAELEAYNAAKQNLFKKVSKTGYTMEGFSPAARRIMTKEFIQSAALLGVVFIILGQTANASTAEVKQLALNPDLAFQLDPRNAADAEVLNAAENIPQLKEELDKNYDAVHDVASLPKEEMKAVFNIAVQKSKEINFGQRNTEKTQQEILKKYGAENFRNSK